jgi:alpha-L-arabinofuranosidase
MCNTLGIEPMLTLAYDSNNQIDFADLVEYAWGDATNTAWGRTRAFDGHPGIYNVTLIELGNEQYNPNWVDQVAAMEARRVAIGAPEFRYLFPNNGGLNAADATRAVNLGLPIERILADIHVGANGGVENAQNLFNNPPIPNFNQSAFNGETNAATHHMQRALQEAADLIDFFTFDPQVTNRIYARTASFCTGTGSHYDTWDQGISFFLPNMTWFQPPGYVHIMISNTWADVTLQSSATAGNLPFAAQMVSNSKNLVFRAVNSAASSQDIIITLGSGSLAGPTYTLWTLSGPDNQAVNTPGNPTAISPVQQQVPITNGATMINATLPPYTFAIMELTMN